MSNRWQAKRALSDACACKSKHNVCLQLKLNLSCGVVCIEKRNVTSLFGLNNNIEDD